MSDEPSQIPSAEQSPEPPREPTPATTETPPAKGPNYLGQMALGCALFFFLLMGGGGVVGTIATLRGNMSGNAWVTGLLIGLTLTLAGLGVSARLWRARRGRGYVAGLLLALGLVGLAAGICFVATR